MTRNTKLSTPNNRVIAPQSTCKSIKHQVSVLPHWFIPSLLPLHLVGTSNSDSNGPGKELIYLGIFLASVPQSRYQLDQGDGKDDTLPVTLPHASTQVSFPSFSQERGVWHSVPSSQDNMCAQSTTGNTKRKDP